MQILELAFQACVTKAYEAGLGKHDASLSYDEAVLLLKWTWISTTPAILVSVVARISIAVLLVRIFSRAKWLKIFLIYFTLLQSLAAVALIIIVWAQVSPVQGLWDVLLPARRWDTAIQQNMAYATQGESLAAYALLVRPIDPAIAALFTFSDLTYVLFPTLIIFRLKMPLRQQLGLAVLMAASLFTMTASVMKCVTSQSSSATNAAFNASLAVLWSGIEQSLVIIMGCVPPLRALSKLDFGVFEDLRTSIASLVGRGSTNKSRSNIKSSLSGGRSGNDDLEMSADDASSKGLAPKTRNLSDAATPTNVTYITTGQKGNDNVVIDGDTNIHRTDQFVISHTDEGQAWNHV